MSSTLEKLASQLADDTMKAMKETGNDRLYVEIGDFLGSTSQTLEEAYLTEVRVRMAEKAARKFLDSKLTEYRASVPQKPPQQS